MGVVSGLISVGVLLSPNLLIPPDPAGAQQIPPPTIVLIVTDDQRWDTLWAMPNVQTELVDHGVTFSNAFASNPLCCPSRTTILTGQYSHTTGVYTNSLPFGGFKKFDDDSTIATWLDTAGYQTALIGKYLNEYKVLYQPPGWDRMFAFVGSGSGGAYYDYNLNQDGIAVPYGSAPGEYSTDVLADEAERYIQSADASAPIFMMFTPFGPHTPATPAPRHQGMFSGLAPARPSNFDEADVSDKPAWVQQLPRMSATSRSRNDAFRRRQYEALLAVDDAVGRIVDALRTSGRLSNSMVVFMTDNGLAWGEHRYTNKKQPYEESIRLPMVIRYDPTTPSAMT